MTAPPDPPFRTVHLDWCHYGGHWRTFNIITYGNHRTCKSCYIRKLVHNRMNWDRWTRSRKHLYPFGTEPWVNAIAQQIEYLETNLDRYSWCPEDDMGYGEDPIPTLAAEPPSTFPLPTT